MSGLSTPRRRPVALAAVLAVVLSLVGPAQAQDEVEDLREQREETRREAAAAAAELDALSAEDRELVQALADLDAHISLQESKVAAAETAIVEAEARAEAAAAEAAALVIEMDSIRLRLRDRAVDAFVGTGREEAEQLSNGDLTGEAVRRFLLDEVVDDEIDLVDDLRTAEARRAEAERIATEAAAEAEAERVALRARLVELEVARVEAEELRIEVEARIAEWEATASVMAQADADISAEIRRFEEEAARQAAEVEARRLSAEEASEADVPESGDLDDAAEDSDAVEAEFVPPADGSFAISHRPVTSAVSSGFGPRIHPIFGTTRMHTGIDFNGGTGDPISAAAAGTVLTSGWMNGYGNTVVISHGNGFTTLYAHQSSIAVATGDTVAGGELVGSVGSTGWSTGPHLHFEVRIDGTTVDPDPYLP